MKRNENCNRCMLCTHPYHTICLWGRGPVPAKLMIIGEAPGREEDRRGEPFVGAAGKLLDHIISKLGLDVGAGLFDYDIYFTNVVKCRPHENKLPTGQDLRDVLEACWPYLEQEIKDVDPKAILILGGTAMHFLLGLSQVTKYESMEVETLYSGAKTFVGLHPAYILRSPSKEVNLAQSIAIAAKAAGLKVKGKNLEDGGGMYPYEVRS